MATTPFPSDSGVSAHRDVADLLLALSGLLQRLRVYPDGHSALEPGAQLVMERLTNLLAERETLRVEVGEVQLLVDGMDTSPDFDPLRELALELRRAGIGALEFTRGISRPELLDALSALASRTGGGGGGGGISLVRLSGPHLSFHLLPEPERSPEQAWLTLERVILEDPGLVEPGRDPAELALALELHRSDLPYDRAVLLALASCARAGGGDKSLARLLAALPAATLRRLTSPRGDWALQRTFLIEAIEVLPPALTLRVLVMTARARGRPLGPATQRLLGKLARLARSGGLPARRLSGEALAMESRRVLATLDRGSPGESVEGSLGPEPDRLLKLSLENGVVEEGSLLAVDAMLRRREGGNLLTLLETVPREDPVARALRGRLSHPRSIRTLTCAEPPDLDALERLVPGCGIEAAPVLLEALATARERSVRLRLLDLAERYGDAIGPLAIERFQGMPWYVERNLLHLLGRLPAAPSDFRIDSFIRHADPRVRHEAVALLIRDPRTRARGLAEGIASRHEPTARLALETLAESCPPELSGRILARLAGGDWSEEVRALAITAVAPVRQAAVLRQLRRLVVGRKLVGLGRLAPKSPSMLAALRGLATQWKHERGVTLILATARQSRDPEIRGAARPPEQSGAPERKG
jgi:hypothetical protein